MSRALTIAAMQLHKWSLVLLHGKQPACVKGQSWPITTDPRTVAQHTQNIGLVCGEISGVAVLDFDDSTAEEALFTRLGPLVRHVRTGSGKFHCYIAYEPNLPAKLRYQESIIGELQRGPGLQQVVMPDSIHPDTQQPYTWLVDPRDPLPTLPEPWRRYLLDVPTHEPTTADWNGPSAEELLRLAMKQPGARRRSTGVKFQCPQCAAGGWDIPEDNAQVFLDGRWGCAYAPKDAAHRRAIGVALGVITDIPEMDATLSLAETTLLRSLDLDQDWEL